MYYGLLIFYVVILLSGCFMFRRVFFGRENREQTPLILLSASFLFCIVFTLFSLCTLKRSSIYLVYTLFYIGYSFVMMFLYWFSYEYSKLGDFTLISSFSLYTTGTVVVMLIINYFHHYMFSLEFVPFAGNIYYVPRFTMITSYTAWVVFGDWLFLTFMCIFNLIRGYISSPRIYQIRYMAVIVVMILHTVYHIVAHNASFPLWLKNIFFVPFCGMVIYFSTYYSDKKFKDTTLLYTADNLADGLILYGEDDRLIYVNERLQNLLHEDVLVTFESKVAFEQWVNDSEDLNGLSVKHIKVQQVDYYFTLLTHRFDDRKSYVGTAYSLQDVTPTVERLEIVENANEELKRAAHMKSDFLANMSHEIRTPMNAVIGMAEMALREDMSEDARDYINQIKSSGKTLLNIINDILDFSKIESGKMEIIPDIYEPLSELTDVASTLMTRIGDKDIELTVQQDINTPVKLEGDSLRIRQILINLCNNAIKFTNKGRVQIITECTLKDEDTADISFHVIDTGIGIKDEDLSKLFNSFQQVDTKRNRNIEGTGLGLAISKNLVLAMGGSISVKSEYGKGSDFYFKIPQKIIDPSPCITVNEPEKIFAIGMFSKKYLARRFFIDTNRMGVFSTALANIESFDDTLQLYEDMISTRRTYLFFEENAYDSGMKKLLSENPWICGIMIAEYTSMFKPDLPNLRVYRKPFSTYVIAMALGDMEIHSNAEGGGSYSADFIAPDARVLVVDDNAINITIAEGLLEPLKMQIDSALSGRQAIEMAGRADYDIIFMDHMMPEMDGVAATRIIRNTIPSCKDVPIIALTANAISGVKEYFLSVGMNDFVPKPIEINELMTKVRTWLPKSKIVKANESVSLNSQCDERPEIPGFNTEEAVKMLGSVKVYNKILLQYYENGHNNLKDIQALFDSNDWENYTIKVHALKSSSRQIGASELGDMAYEMEMAGKNGDYELIRNKNSELMDKYADTLKTLSAFCVKEDNVEKKKVTREEILAILTEIERACDELDTDLIDENAEKLQTFMFSMEADTYVQRIIRAAGALDVDEAEEAVSEFIKYINEIA